MIKPKFFILFLLLNVLNFSQALASITLAPAIIDFDPGKALKKDIIILNTGKQTEYVAVTANLIDNPGTADEKRILIKNPTEFGLLVSPTKLTIPPNQTRYVRVFITKPPSKTDIIYRLAAEPTFGKLIVRNNNSDNTQAGLKMIVGYGVLIMVRPQNPKPIIVLKRIGNHVTALNQGNTNVMLIQGKQCINTNNCIKIGGRRLYAGNKWTFTLPKAAPVSFRAVYMNQGIDVTSN